MGRRDIERFERDVRTRREALGDGPHADILAHLAATRHESEMLAAKAASLMAALAQAPEHAEPIREHYRELLQRFGSSEAGRRERLAFFAAEGAFLLRGLGITRMSEAEWTALFDDLALLAEGEA
jgi:hypothetical protein